MRVVINLNWYNRNYAKHETIKASTKNPDRGPDAIRTCFGAAKHVSLLNAPASLMWNSFSHNLPNSTACWNNSTVLQSRRIIVTLMGIL